MTFFYSPSVNGFSDTMVNMPEDTIEITDELHASLFTPSLFQPQEIQPDANGFPILVNKGPISLTGIKAHQLASNKKAFEADINGGFTSTALNAVNTYPSTALDQQNLTATVVDAILHQNDESWTSTLICKNSDEVWAYVEHTQAQIKQVGTDCKSHILSKLLRFHQLNQQVNDATTVAAVLAITW